MLTRDWTDDHVPPSVLFCAFHCSLLLLGGILEVIATGRNHGSTSVMPKLEGNVAVERREIYVA